MQLTASNKLSPADHSLKVMSKRHEWMSTFKASQTVGSLHTTVIHLVSKKAEKEKKMRKPQKQQPFEVTWPSPVPSRVHLCLPSFLLLIFCQFLSHSAVQPSHFEIFFTLFPISFPVSILFQVFLFSFLLQFPGSFSALFCVNVSCPT